MTTENLLLKVTREAAESLANDQYRVVVLTSARKVQRPNAATDIPYGILQNAPASGEAAVIAPINGGGISKIVLGATLTAGTLIGLEYVGAADAGKAQAAVSTQYPVGLLEEGGVEDDLGSVSLGNVVVKA